jgi:peptidoglycan/xylan/chitin deacetylase (PgdA/CDA1 family)
MWDVDSEDWKNKYSGNESEEEKRAIAERIANNVISNVKDGSIILMHDIYGSTYDALAIVLEQLYAEGYEVVTVSELIGSDLHSGEKYFSGR